MSTFNLFLNSEKSQGAADSVKHMCLE